jgi:hypothetical protein
MSHGKCIALNMTDKYVRIYVVLDSHLISELNRYNSEESPWRTGAHDYKVVSYG